MQEQSQVAARLLFLLMGMLLPHPALLTRLTLLQLNLTFRLR